MKGIVSLDLAVAAASIAVFTALAFNAISLQAVVGAQAAQAAALQESAVAASELFVKSCAGIAECDDETVFFNKADANKLAELDARAKALNATARNAIGAARRGCVNRVVWWEGFALGNDGITVLEVCANG